mmetsp:Transcript_3274/g.11057  ORF Transcript_3274/g.11057 Transcript_3274/m.11057 type:complete len:206 (+) Transcript_3274:121-738(+)
MYAWRRQPKVRPRRWWHRTVHPWARQGKCSWPAPGGWRKEAQSGGQGRGRETRECATCEHRRRCPLASLAVGVRADRIATGPSPHRRPPTVPAAAPVSAPAPRQDGPAAACYAGAARRSDAVACPRRGKRHTAPSASQLCALHLPLPSCVWRHRCAGGVVAMRRPGRGVPPPQPMCPRPEACGRRACESTIGRVRMQREIATCDM